MFWLTRHDQFDNTFFPCKVDYDMTVLGNVFKETLKTLLR